MACIVFLASMIATGAAQKPTSDLATASLEDLMNLEVTSVSKKEEKLFQTAAAVYVITQEEIRRSGLTSIPELLRLAAGLNVARVNESTWAISARGFNHRFANKLLVLIDGRSVYTPLFSGVFWNVQDLMLEDVERIEIIRGPGGSLWGANAVNGVINIITKQAADTQGGLVSAGSGSEDRGFGAARFGRAFGSHAFFRVYTKYFKRFLTVEDEDGDGGEHADEHSHRAEQHDWSILRSGFRLDWKKTGRDSLTFQGDFYRGSERAKAPLIPGRSPEEEDEESEGARDAHFGGNLMLRWNRISARSDLGLQFFYDRTYNNDRYLDESRNTFDLELQHRITPGKRHDIVWGLGHRFSRGNSENDTDDIVTLDPARQGVSLISAFAQDRIMLVRDRIWMTLGAKYEHHGFAGGQVQPNARFLWSLDHRHVVWASVSRALRTPSRVERDSKGIIAQTRSEDGQVNLVTLSGNRNFASESLVASEVGYRVQPSKRFSLDWTAFHHSYDHLKTTEPGIPSLDQSHPLPMVILPYQYNNLMRAVTYGTEASVNASLTTHWKLSGSYTFFHAHFRRKAGSRDLNLERTDQSSPDHQFQLRSYLNLPRNLEFDASLNYVGALVGQGIPAYTRLDVRFGWQLTERISLSVAAQNLLEKRHQEFGAFGQGVHSDEIGRSLYGKATWRF